jgi:hypothetical protein
MDKTDQTTAAVAAWLASGGKVTTLKAAKAKGRLRANKRRL